MLLFAENDKNQNKNNCCRCSLFGTRKTNVVGLRCLLRSQEKRGIFSRIQCVLEATEVKTMSSITVKSILSAKNF